jgi:hypothetical protein
LAIILDNSEARDEIAQEVICDGWADLEEREHTLASILDHGESRNTIVEMIIYDSLRNSMEKEQTLACFLDHGESRNMIVARILTAIPDDTDSRQEIVYSISNDKNSKTEVLNNAPCNDLARAHLLLALAEEHSDEAFREFLDDNIARELLMHSLLRDEASVESAMIMLLDHSTG